MSQVKEISKKFNDLFDRKRSGGSRQVVVAVQDKVELRPLENYKGSIPRPTAEVLARMHISRSK